MKRKTNLFLLLNKYYKETASSPLSFIFFFFFFVCAPKFNSTEFQILLIMAGMINIYFHSLWEDAKQERGKILVVITGLCLEQTVVNSL